VTEGPVQRLKGRGQIYRGSAKVMDADYEITVTQPEIRGATFEPGQEPKVAPDISGRLLGPLFEAEHLEGVHTLVLDDGRSFDFRILQPDTNEIVGVSWFRDEAPRR
jgi:hypothetical protein